MTVNKVILIGNLGQDPELRTTQGGTPVCTLRIATTERRKDREGNWSDHTEWHNVVIFGRNAENVHRYLKKGRQIYIEGRLQTRKWQDRNGQERWTTEVIAENIRFLGTGGGASSVRRDEGGREAGIRDAAGGDFEPPPIEESVPFDDDIPF